MDALTTALDALTTYDLGSGRALLIPIDQAVNHAANDPAERKALEERLLRALASARSVPAKEFVCSKLRVVGSDAAVPALGGLLADPKLSTAARAALEGIASKAAVRELRSSLRTLTGVQKTGVVDSLGTLRDADSVDSLATLIDEENPKLSASAVCALGKIGTSKAAKALSKAKVAGKSSRPGLADAILVCAERLSADGANSRARSLCSLLLGPEEPVYIRQAAENALRRSHS